MQKNSTQVIETPTAAQVLAIERKLKGERLEMFQEAFDVLHEEKQAESDSVVKWRIENLAYLYRGFKRVDRETRVKDSRPAGVLHIKLNQGDVKHDLGLASVNVVTTAGVNYVIDAFQNLVEVENLKYHGSGTSNTAEAVGDTALGVEVGTRVAGTQIEGASENIYQTVATLTYGSSLSITEHGLFSASTAGTLFDRSVFTAIAVDASTGIEFTYEWTLQAGG